MLKEKPTMLKNNKSSISEVGSDQQQYDFKQWRAEKKSVEESLLTSLKEHLPTKSTDLFEASLIEGVSNLNLIYGRMPNEQKNAAPENTFRNKCLRQFFCELCSTEGSSEFITIITAILPIENEPNQQYKNQYPIHVALNARAFSNAETLLKLPGVDVDAMWQKQTPLMMLFKMATTGADYQTVRQLIVLLGEQGADINLGDYRAHPVSVLCRSAKLELDQKRELLEICREAFVCDLDSSFEGQARKDVEAIFEDLKFDPAQSEITAATMECLLLEVQSQEFINEFDAFVAKSPEPDRIYQLLKSAATKNRIRCVQKMLETISRNPDQYDPLKHKKVISITLKFICARGYPEVLKLFLTHLKPAEVFNEKPLGLVCVRNLAKKVTDELCECLDILLEDSRIAFDKTDHERKGALEYAIEHGKQDVVRRIMGIDKKMRKKE